MYPSTPTRLTRSTSLALSLALLLGGVPFFATVAIAQNQSTSVYDEEPISLSPFQVSSEGDDGYRAANTLAGTRMNTSLFQTPAAVTILTKELLEDTGAKTTSDFLNFATNSGTSDLVGDPTGANAQVFDVRVKIRGFGDAGAGSITRDYFMFPYASDRYNIDRVDVNRGPNAVLYGIGGPGGVINTSSKQAILNGQRKSISASVGSWDARRSEIDLSFPLIRNQLALRVNGVLEEKDGWRDFEYFKQKGVALAGVYKPFRKTLVRVSGERMDRKQSNPGFFPPSDQGGSKWIAAGAPLSGNPLLPGTNPAPTLLRNRTLEQVVYAPQLRSQPFRLSTIGADMRPDLAGTQAPGYWETLPGPAAPSTGTIDDPHLGSLIPMNASLGGPGNKSPNDYTIGNVIVEQKVGPFALELAYGHLNYRRSIATVPAPGLIGDPNIVLPGAYYADGDSRVAAGRLPGTLLPDIAAVNPYAGGLYVEGQATTRDIEHDQDHMRASLAYELDLTKKNRWLGRHNIAGLWQYVDRYLTDVSAREYNVAPNNNQLIDSATNIIIRRTYLDFASPNGQRGALDPAANPIPTSAGMRAQFVQFGPAPQTTQKSGTWMIADQSSFLENRIVVTGGYREDVVRTNASASGGERLPNSTNLWTKGHTLFDPSRETKFKGETTTFGVVVSPLTWLGIAYNQSNSLVPQANVSDIFWQTLAPVDGKGKDLGLRMNLLNQRLYINLNAFRTVEQNKFASAYSTPRTQAVPALNSILETQVRMGQALPASLVAAGVTELLNAQNTSGSRETYNSNSEGMEFELVGRITKGWSVSLNLARNKMRVSDVAPVFNRFLAEVKGAWDGNMTPVNLTDNNVATFVRQRDNTPNRDFVLNPATFNDTYDYAVAVIDAINRSEGQTPLAQIEDTANLFTSYRFTRQAPSVLKLARAGVGANYRSAPVIGYDASKGNAPIMGDSTFMMNAMVGKMFPLKDRRSIDIQLNVNNLLGNHDMLAYSASAPGQVLRYSYQRHRSWELRATYNF